MPSASETETILIFTNLAPWRVLGIDKCGALTRAAAKHTPRKGNKNNTENQTASAAARSRPR